MRVDPRAVHELLDVELGASYRDDATGFEGTAVGVWIKAGGIVDVQLAHLKVDGTVVECWFGGDRIVGASDGNGVGFAHR